jgi:hypothetical protein
MTVPTVPSEAVEAALNSLLAEPCFPDFLYEPARASAAQIAEVRQANLEAVERAFAAAVPVLQAQERERLKRVIEAKRDAFGPTQALAWSQGMSAAAFICSLAVPEEPGDLQPNRCRLTPGPHDPHEWPGAVTGKPYWCDGRNNPVINRGAN